MTAGRVTLSTRAIERTFGALAAEELGVPASSSSVDLSDERGQLRVSVTAPVALGRGTVLEAAQAARQRVLADGPALTGATIASARVRVRSLHDAEPRRVR